ncbi:methyltransferase [Tetrasphaera phage TJE1]|uniref:Methyltransferase n=1 Tax=Tetrasphaera phage TJE1 TaxID=981335 RepID=G4W944_9CAUD|nr:methyltransferase [Tetrasphaera phage TJE1]ADX42532.1 methyltransferase [Tetrasphaera phage TJE1]
MGKGSVLVDIGASVGEWGDEILPQLIETKSLLVCMEPASWCLERLAQWVNDRGHGYATILSAAITWRQNKVQNLSVADSYLISHLQDLPGTPMERWGGHLVRVDPVVGLTMKGMMDAAGFDSVDLVKMDIEGAEVPVLLQSEDEVFDRVRNFAIAAYHEYQGKLTWEILEPFLISKGYKVLHENEPYREFPAMHMIYATKDGSF